MSQKKKVNRTEQDDINCKLPTIYRKKCQANGLVVNKMLRDRLEVAVEDGRLELLQFWQQLGPVQVRSLMECLIDLKYPHLTRLRLWKVDAQDQGLRSICNYVEKCNTLQYLDLMNNNITQLGCQFIAKVFNNTNCNISKLRLDNNPIQNSGLKALAMALRESTKLQKLSLNYCQIDEDAVMYIQQIMANINCKLRTLKLEGNPLLNKGVYQVLRAVKICGNKLQKLILNDVHLNILNYKQEIGLSEEQKINKQLISILRTNTSICKYGFKNNWICDKIAMNMLDEVKNNKNIFIINMPDCISHSLKQIHAQIMKKRKLKKKKKKNQNKKKNKK